MATQLVTDYTGEPLAVVVDYKQWLEIVKQLTIPIVPDSTVKERNPFDWYDLTESLNSVLNGVISMASREHMKELDKIRPDLERIAFLVGLRDEVFEINSNPLNFKNLDRMEELIDKYSPILKEGKLKNLS